MKNIYFGQCQEQQNQNKYLSEFRIFFFVMISFFKYISMEYGIDIFQLNL